MISLFHEDFVFTKLRMFRENKTLTKFSEFTVALVRSYFRVPQAEGQEQVLIFLV